MSRTHRTPAALIDALALALGLPRAAVAELTLAEALRLMRAL